MFLALIIISILIFLLTVNFVITTNLSFDAINNNGQIKIVLFNFIPIFKSNISFSADYLNLFTEDNKKEIKIRLNLNDEAVLFFNDVNRHLGNKVVVSQVDTFFLICAENPSTACVLSSVVNIAICLAYSKLLTNRFDTFVNKNVLTGFRQTKFELKLKITIVIGLYNYLWALLLASRDKRRRQYEKEQRV